MQVMKKRMLVKKRDRGASYEFVDNGFRSEFVDDARSDGRTQIRDVELAA